MMKKIETVLIGTSLTEASDPVVRDGVELARRAGAKIHLAHAYSPPMSYSGSPFFPEVPVGEVLKAERAALQRRFDDQLSRLGIDRLALAGIHLEVGPAHRYLVDTARETGADLIVVGSSETPRLARLFGSTADRVVRKAACPVLVIRGELPIPPRRVLLPVDLSPLSAEAFETALGYLAPITDRSAAPEFEALFVLTELDRQALLPRATAGEVEQLAEQELRRFVAGHAGRFPGKVASRVESDFVDTEILHRIEVWKPDLVLLGTHGRSGFERFMLGSVAASVVRDGKASVLVVPPRAAREGEPAETRAGDRTIHVMS